MKKKKLRKKIDAPPAELNIMPFIDIFSMLNTFLLVSAAFVNIGQLEVQIPFLTNAPPPPPTKTRNLNIHIAIERDKVELETKFDSPPTEEKKTEYKMTKEELLKLHKDLVQLRKSNPESDKINLFSEDDVQYDTVVKVLDTIMVRVDGDPAFTEKDANGIDRDSDLVYRKVIMADVIL